MKSSAIETLVGAIIIALAIGFFTYAYTTAGLGTGASGGYHVSAEFDNASGIAVGTDVRVAGIKVGTVTGQSLNPKSFQARIDMMLSPTLSLADDTSAKISSEGLLGANFISLEPGGADEKLKEGSIISYTQGAVDLWSLISQAMFSKSPKPSDAPAPAIPDAPAQ